MDRQGHVHHDGRRHRAWAGRGRFFIDTKKFTGKAMMAYGQHLHHRRISNAASRASAGGQIIDEVSRMSPSTT